MLKLIKTNNGELLTMGLRNRMDPPTFKYGFFLWVITRLIVVCVGLSLDKKIIVYGSRSISSAELAAAMFTIIQTVSLWKLNRLTWLYHYFECCMDNNNRPLRTPSFWIAKVKLVDKSKLTLLNRCNLSILKLHYLYSLLLILSLPLAEAAPAPIQDYEAEYQLYWQGLLVGTSLHTVKQIDQHDYIAVSRSFPKLKFLPYQDFERSEFTIHPHQVQPKRYTFQTQQGRKKLEGVILFDWKKKRVTKIINTKKQVSKQDPLPPLSQDKITQFFQLREDLKAGKRDFSYTLIEPKKTNHWKIRVLGSERLHTPLGTLDTLKLEHVSDNQERCTQFWLAKDYDYLMVRLIQIRKGKKTAEVFIRRFQPG